MPENKLPKIELVPCPFFLMEAHAAWAQDQSYLHSCMITQALTCSGKQTEVSASNDGSYPLGIVEC